MDTFDQSAFTAAYNAPGTSVVVAGREWSPTANPYGYTTRELDPESLLLHYRLRTYSPTLRQFLQRDPLGYFDSPNLYQYVLGNPLRYADALGLAGGYSDPFFEVDSFMEKRWRAMLMVKSAAAITLEVMEVFIKVSTFSDWYEAFSGKDVIAGEDISTVERALAIAGIFGGAADDILDMIRGLAKMKKASRVVDDIDDISDAAKGAKKLPGTLCFVAGTLVLTANGGVPIEEIDVGDRVVTTDSPDGPSVEWTSVEPGTWRLVTLEMPNPDGSDDVLQIELLRPLEWISSVHAEAGGWIEFSLPEMSIEGPAAVVSIAPCPPIEAGVGRVVLGTVTHLNAFVLEITLEGLEEPLEPTRTHPLFSEARGDWVPAGELEVGDRLRTRTGWATILDIRPKRGMHRVYNLEVETEHWYYTSPLEVLSHNACGEGKKEFPKGPGTRQGRKNIERTLPGARREGGGGHIGPKGRIRIRGHKGHPPDPQGPHRRHDGPHWHVDEIDPETGAPIRPISPPDTGPSGWLPGEEMLRCVIEDW
ncbi:MAG TPA: RHS repeat-associated core domain-containing protein [Phycisphaerae bacterium]|nr:RHS repeat-associated core domain-containing protein [Phycisphaerae bacterium]